MTGTVRAAVLTKPRTIEIRDLPRPEIGPDDGLLRVEACGICGSDVEQYHGTLGRDLPEVVPGHETLGVVEEVGERAARRWGVQPGDRVAMEILIPCRACMHCLDGRYMSCPKKLGAQGYTPLSRAPGLWGGMAEYFYMHPNAIVHPVRSDVPVELAAMFNPLGAGVRWACDLGRAGLGDTVLVLGAGQRGIFSVLAAKAAGAATVIVTGLTRDRAKLELARSFGADHTIDVERENTVEKVADLTGGRLADVVLELTPMAHQPVRDALACVRHGGRVVQAGLKGPNPIEIPTDTIVNKAINLVGAYGVDSRAYAEAIRIIESGRYPLEKLHTHTFGLDDAARAIDTLAGDVPGEEAVHVMIAPGNRA